jgi:hypothetical protein
MEQIIKNLGVGFAFLAIMVIWLGFALWMRVEADKRNMLGWAWAFGGVLLPVVSWVIFLVVRSRHPIAEEVVERDEVLEEAKRQNELFILQKPPPKTPPVAEPAPTEGDSVTTQDSITAALEAEQRRYQ